MGIPVYQLWRRFGGHLGEQIDAMEQASLSALAAYVQDKAEELPKWGWTVVGQGDLFVNLVIVDTFIPDSKPATELGYCITEHDWQHADAVKLFRIRTCPQQSEALPLFAQD